MGMNVLIAAVTGVQPDALRPWLGSFRQVNPTAAIRLIVDPISAIKEMVPLATEYRVELYAGKLEDGEKPDSLDHWRKAVSIYRLRWSAISEVLGVLLDPNDTVLVTDPLDVVFQRDPFIYRDEMLHVAGEGVLFKDDIWNKQHLQKLVPDAVTRMAEFETICAGVMMGPVRVVRAVADLLAGLTKNDRGVTDQTRLNLLLRCSLPHHQWELSPPINGWCVHLAQLLTPWSNQRKLVVNRPHVHNGIVMTSDQHLPYAIVHHWPMVPQLKHLAEIR